MFFAIAVDCNPAIKALSLARTQYFHENSRFAFKARSSPDRRLTHPRRFRPQLRNDQRDNDPDRDFDKSVKSDDPNAAGMRNQQDDGEREAREPIRGSIDEPGEFLADMPDPYAGGAAYQQSQPEGRDRRSDPLNEERAENCAQCRTDEAAHRDSRRRSEARLITMMVVVVAQ